MRETSDVIDYKHLDESFIRQCLDDLGYRFKKPPRKHQLVSLIFALDYDRKRVQYFHDIGTGKTAAALFTAQVWGSKKILVVCPNSAFWAWKHNIKQFTDYSYSFLKGSFADRVSGICEQRDVNIINYEGLKTLYADKIKAKKLDSGKVVRKGGWKINPEYFYGLYDTVIFDEVHRCKGHDSIQTRICYELSRRAEHAIGLSGTPIGKTYLDLFGVFLVIDLGASLGTNFYSYRRRYFDRFKYFAIRDGAEDEILQKIAPACLSYDISECVDLPEQSPPILRTVLPTKEQKNLFSSICDELKEEFAEGKLVINNVANKSSKLRQVGCGFLYLTENEEKTVKYLKKNPKIDALSDIIDECSSKIVVFHNLESEAVVIERLCKRKKIKYSAIRGSVSLDDRTIQYENFVNDEDVKLMIAQYECASESYDMTCSHVGVFFSPVASPRLRNQAMGRIHRTGQTAPCIFIDIVMKGSSDLVVMSNMVSNVEMANNLLDFIRNYH